jgi:hypothetical protein
MSVFGSDCVMVIFSLITCFPSLTWHTQTGSQADKIHQYLYGASTVHSVVSSQWLYISSPPFTTPIASAWLYFSVPSQVGTY